MSRRALLRRLTKPGLPISLLLVLLCVPALLYIFVNKLEESPAAYLVYVLSAYTLFVWCMRVPTVVKRVRAAIYRHSLGRRYMTDLVFRRHISLYTSTAVNLCYALFKLCAGIYYRSFWFGAIAVYYILLTAARALLLQSIRRGASDMGREYRVTRLCGILLFVLNLALSAVTVQMVTGGKGYEYPGYLIFVMAGYAFFSVSSAVVNIVRTRRLNSPVLSASCVLGLATALVSMLSLQTAMFAAFGGTYEFQRLMNALTGGAVCLIICVMSVLMTMRADKKIKEIGYI